MKMKMGKPATIRDDIKFVPVPNETGKFWIVDKVTGRKLDLMTDLGEKK